MHMGYGYGLCVYGTCYVVLTMVMAVQGTPRRMWGMW